MLELMLRAIVMGALVTVAALLLDRGLAHLRTGKRHAWTFALLATSVAPWLPRWTAARVEALPVLEMPTIVVNATSQAGSRVPVDLLVLAWMVSALSVLVMYAVAYVKLIRARRAWQPARIAQADVLMSEHFGPAVFGFIAPRIVVPRWIQDASRAEQALIVLHEREHIRAGDQLHLLLAIVSTVLMPWNPFIWLQARRLRFTIEADCDQRVLAAAPDRAEYASLLVNVGSRQSGLLLTPALAEHNNGLEARVIMVANKLIRSRWKAAGFMAAGVVVAFAACESRMPQEVTEQSAARVTEVPMKRTQGEVPVEEKEMESLPRKILDREPHFTPHTIRPELANRAEVRRALVNSYPALLRDAGIGGSVLAWLLVDESGKVIKTRIKESSGRTELDAAALKVAESMEFTPAENEGKPVKVWITLPIVFKTK